MSKYSEALRNKIDSILIVIDRIDIDGAFINCLC